MCLNFYEVIVDEAKKVSLFWFFQQCYRLVTIKKHVFVSNYCGAPHGSIKYFNKLVWTSKLKIQRMFIRCSNLVYSAVFKKGQVNV